MRIRTQILITMLLFGIILVVFAVTAIIVNQLTRKANEQENIASSIAQGANELSYLSNDYLIYRESQQLKRWQIRFASFSSQVARLNVNKPDQQALVRNMQAGTQRLKEVFESVASTVRLPAQNQSAVLDLSFFQVSWSRMAVQSQGLVSDASRLSQLLHQQMDQLRETRTMLMYVMVGLFGLFLLASYMLTYRRILKSIMILQAGTAVIGSGNLDFKIEEKKNDEIGDLSRAFNRMTADLNDVTASKSELEGEIAERKKAEEELRQQREWLRVTLSSIGDAVIATDTKGRITFLNPVAITLTGWQSEEALNQPINSVFRIINEKTHTPAEDLVARVLSERRVVALANDTALITKDGREILIEDSAAPIKDSAGNLIGVVLVFHDVTEKRRAQVALREAHDRAAWLARFPEQNPNPVMRASSDGTVLYCNPASGKHLGWSCEVGQRLQNELLPLFVQAMAAGKELQWDVQIEGRVYFIWIAPVPEEGYANIYGRDITERKRAEDALSRSQKTFSELVERAPFGIYVVDSQFRIAQMNAGSQTGAFRNVRPVIGRDFAEAMRILWPEPVAAEIIGHFHHTLETGEPYYSPRFINPRHDVVTVESYEWELHRMMLPDGQYGVICYYFDSTRLREAEAAVRESDERLRFALEACQIGAWDLDLADHTAFRSLEHDRIFGYAELLPEWTYEMFLEHVLPEDRPRVNDEFQRSMDTQSDWSFECRIRRVDGEVRWIWAAGHHRPDVNGLLRRMAGIVQDITERKRAEEQLRESEEKSRLLIKYAPSMFYEIDFHRPAFKSVNDAMCQFLGYTREELLAMNPFDLLDDEGKAVFRERIRRKLTGEAVSDSVEYKSRTKDGREVHGVLNISFTYKDGKPEGAVVVAHDVTERKRAEEALKQRSSELQNLAETLEQRVKERTEELEEANKALRQLSIRLLSAHEEERKRVAGELHDTIGSCLSGIKFKVESALEEITKTPKAATESLSTIVPVIRDAIEECRRIQMDLRPSMLDDLGLLPTLSWFFRRFQTIYSTIHIEQEMSIEESEMPNSLKIVIYRVIQEAMNNTAKHSKADLVRISLRKVHNKMDLFVEDNGCGFSVQQRLFLDDSRRGLGLTSMRERTELSGGSFTVESAEGKGTIICASWPI